MTATLTPGPPQGGQRERAGHAPPPPRQSSAPAGAERRPPGHDHDLPATIALAVLTLVAGLGLGRLFSDASFVPGVVLAAVATHAVAWGCRRLRFGGPLTALVSIATLVLVPSWAVLGASTAYGIPWAGTLAAANDELSQAWQRFTEVVAPTPVNPGFVLAAMLGVCAVGFLADWAAFRVGAVLEAIVPSATVFVFASVLAPGRYLVAATGGWLAALLAFVVVYEATTRGGPSWFASRSKGGPEALLRPGLALAVAAVVVGLVVGPLLPGANDPPTLDWREGAGGSGRRVTTSPLVDVRGRLIERADVEVFSVRSDQRSYWRYTALDRFNGEVWESNGSYEPSDGRLETGPGAPAGAATVTQEFEISRLETFWLPAAYEPVAVSGVRGLRYNADLQSFITDRRTADGQRYTVESRLPDHTPEQLRGATSTSPPGDRYVQLPDVSDRIRSWAIDTVRAAGATSPYDQAIALQNRLRGSEFTYDINTQQGREADAIGRFLYDSKTGYCEQFAGSFAVLARTLGLPTRVAVGFTPGESQNGVFRVRDKHAHAWPEVWFDGVGWVPFEPTPGRGVPGGEGYTFVPQQQEGEPAPTTSTTAPTSDIAPGSEFLPDSSLGGSTPGPIRDVEDFSLEGGGVVEPPGPSVASRIRPPLTVLALVGTLTVLGLLGLRAVHRALRRRRARTPGLKVMAAWDEALEALSLAGVPRQAQETPGEYAARAARTTQLDTEGGTALATLAKDTTAASYAADEASTSLADRASASARAVEVSLRRRSGRLDRLRQALDPRPALSVSQRRTAQPRRR